MQASIRHDQRGLGNVLIIVLVILVLVVVGGVAYKVTKKDDTKVTTASVKSAGKEVNAACLKTYKDKELCKFTASYADFEKKPYKLTITSTSAEGDSKSTVLSDGKGNTSVVATVNGKETSYVYYNKATYSKGPGETTWIKYPSTDTTDTSTSSNPASDIKIDTKYDGTDSTITYKKIGKEQCGNATCLKYQVIDSTQPNTTTYVWFNTSKYRLARYTTKDSNNSSTDMTITYQAIKLSAPTPVKDYSAGVDSSTMQQYQNAAGAVSDPNQ